MATFCGSAGALVGAAYGMLYVYRSGSDVLLSVAMFTLAGALACVAGGWIHGQLPTAAFFKAIQDVSDPMNNVDDFIAYFITWSVYGTHLQGDERGWRRWRGGHQLPQPRLAQWRRARLKHDVLLLSPEQRVVVERECGRHCDHRSWHLWEANARSNHVHVVVTAVEYSGKIVRDQLKANCTRGLREQWPVFCDRPVWTVGGDWECINGEDDLEIVCQYVREAQDRMEYKHP